MTSLLDSYQQKVTIYHEEVTMLKQQLSYKDKEMDSMRLQLKNLRRGRSHDRDFSKRVSNNNNNSVENSSGSDESSDSDRKVRSSSVELSDTLTRQAEINSDEVRLLRNKISRLQDDLAYVSQVGLKKNTTTLIYCRKCCSVGFYASVFL